jgi:hypothetical protein
MSTIKILAGDLKACSWDVNADLFGKDFKIQWGIFGSGDIIDLKKEIQSVELMTEDKKKKLIGSAAWGAIGGLALGPIGIAAGLLAGGNKKDVTFACYLKDGRKFMATTDSKTFTKLQALSF